MAQYPREVAHWYGSRVQDSTRGRFRRFVELDGGLDGLIHVSDFSWGGFEGDPRERYSEDQMIRAIMLDIDEERAAPIWASSSCVPILATSSCSNMRWVIVCL